MNFNTEKQSEYFIQVNNVECAGTYWSFPDCYDFGKYVKKFLSKPSKPAEVYLCERGENYRSKI